jgi:hypothetical protein
MRSTFSITIIFMSLLLAVFGNAAVSADFGAAAQTENVWTLGAYNKHQGWPLTSPDGAVTVILSGGSDADFSSGAIELHGSSMYGGRSLVTGEGAIDMRGLVLAQGDRRIKVTALSIGPCFLYEKAGISAFYADHVVMVGYKAFARAKQLGEVSLSGTASVLPDGYSPTHPSIRCGVFSDCPALTNMTLSLPLLSIGSAAFAGTDKLAVDVADLVPKGVTNIGACAFLHAASLRGTLETTAVRSVGTRAFQNAGFDEIRLGCDVVLKEFPSGSSSGGKAYGVFTLCPNLTNLEIRAHGLVSLGNLNFGDSPVLRRAAFDAPLLESLGATRGCCNAMPSLEKIELNTPVLRRVGDSWPPFNASHRLREVVWRSEPPAPWVVKRIMKGVPAVANVAESGKKCVFRVPHDSESWKALASEFEGREAEFAPPGCLGVVFASSRKAWMIPID